MKKDNTQNKFTGIKIKKQKLSSKEKEEMLAIFMKNIENSNAASQKNKVNLKSLLPYLLVAASFSAIIYIFAWKYISEKTILSSDIHTILLSGNTRITLDRGTSVSYRPALFRFNRKVKLSGKAYFDVQTKGAFSVVSAQGTVNVLGTQFSVQTEPVFTTQCYQGMVEVLDNQTQQSLILRPHEKASLINGALHKTSLIESTPYWVNNKFEFENQKLSDVISVMVQHYNIRVTGVEHLDNLDFTGSIPSGDLTVACKLIFGPYDLTYRLNNGTLSIDAPH